MLDMTNRQLWEIITTSSNTQEVEEAVLLLEHRGERGEKLLVVREQTLNKRLQELFQNEQKENALLPKISAAFFVVSSLFLISSVLVILYEQQLDYLLGVPKFLVLSTFLILIRAFFVIKTSKGVIWARYMMLYGILIGYTILIIVGYPGIFRFILLEDLYFGVIFTSHILSESLALFLIFKTFKN